MLVENLSVPFDRRVWREAQTLACAGYRVVVICPKGKEQDRSGYEEREGIKIYRYPLPEASGRLAYLVEYLWALVATFLLTVKTFFREGFDVIHAGNPPDYFFLIGRLFQLWGKKFVYDQHDLAPELYLSRFAKDRPDLLYRLLRWLERCSYRTADVIIVTNESYRALAQSRGRLDGKNMVVVRNGPDIRYFHPVEPQPQLKAGFAFLVCYLGVMGRQDGVEYLLRAIDYIVNRRGRRDVLFVLIGRGETLPELQRMAKALGIEEQVKFTGRIPDREVMAWLSTADLCVSPDPLNPLNDLSTMNKVMEFMACGKAMVSFDLKEARFSAQEAALYVSPNDWRKLAEGVLDLLGDEARRRRMEQYGSQRVTQHLSWQKQETKLLFAYALLGLPGEPSPEKSASFPQQV